MMPAAGMGRIFETLRSPNYGPYVIGNGISLTGTWMQRIAVGWLAWELTQSTLWLGILAFADLFPTVIIGPIGGAFADRADRLRLVQISQSLACLQAATLYLLTAAGMIDIYLLTLATLFLGIVTALNQPARLALVPSLVSPRNLNSAIAINSVIFNLARFIGPAVAGVIIAAGHVSWVFAVNAISFTAFLTILFRLRLRIETRSARRPKRFWTDLADGVVYSLREPAIAMQLFLLVAIGLGARPLVEMLPGFAAAVFAGGPETLALLTSVFGVGAIAGGIWLAGRRESFDLRRVVPAAAFGAAAGLALFAATTDLRVAVPATILIGLALVVTGAGSQTLIQLQVSPDMRGRVLSLYGVILRGGPAIGALAMGWLAEFFGLRWPLAGGALLVALAALVLWRRTPRS